MSGKHTPSHRWNRGLPSPGLDIGAEVLSIRLLLVQVYNPELNRVELVEPAHRRNVAVFTTPVKLENVSETSIKQKFLCYCPVMRKN